MKIMKRASSSMASAYGFGEMETKERSKHQRAQQYYDELLLETMEKKKNLRRAYRKKHVLEAEVRFLRQRYEYLMSIRSPSPQLKEDMPRSQFLQPHTEAVPMDRRMYRERETALPNPAPVPDLNQISMDEEEVEILDVVEPSRVDNTLMKFQTSKGGKPPLPPRRSNVQLPSGVNFICRDIGKGSSQTGKRKISWQDPVALRV